MNYDVLIQINILALIAIKTIPTCFWVGLLKLLLQPLMEFLCCPCILDSSFEQVQVK